MIDVCFSRIGEECLRKHKKDFNSEAVFHLGGYFDTGDITEPVQEHYSKQEAETLRYFYKDISDEEITEAYKDELKQIRTRHTKFRKCLENGESVRVWICNNANEYCGLYWLCNEIQKLNNQLYLVVIPDYEYSFVNRHYTTVYGWGFEEENLTSFADNIKELNKGEISYFAREWEVLKKIKKQLRILVNGSVVSIEKDFFDSAILSFVSEAPIAQSEVMGKFLGAWHCCSVAFVSERIEQMIAKGQINVCEDIVDEHGCYWPRKIAKV